MRLIMFTDFDDLEIECTDDVDLDSRFHAVIVEPGLPPENIMVNGWLCTFINPS